MSSPPQTRQDLPAWVREHLRLPAELENELLMAVDAVFSRHERLWQQSKEEAIQAVSVGFADKLSRLKHELNAKDVTVSSISRYFEQLVADLTDKSHRDPKTKLINFGRFTEQLESFLALEQRGCWSAVGLVDIAGFKGYNDAFGHATGDRIIERVAHLLREQVRSDDLIAQERPPALNTIVSGNDRQRDIHARFGGDEFCFLIPDLADYQQAYTIAERFRKGVEQYDWTVEDSLLGDRPVRVDVGVVCLRLGRVVERRFIARRLSAALIQRADQLMYEAKGETTNQISLLPVKVEGSELVDMTEQEAARWSDQDCVE